MKKKLMPTVIAVVVLLVLLVYANFFEVDDILAPGAQKPEPILNCKASEITAMTWKTPGGEEVKVSINGSDSQILTPAVLRSDKNEIEGLTRHFAELRAELSISDNVEDRKAFGISENSPVVIIEAAGKTTSLTLGNKIEIGNSYYLAKDGDPRIFSVPGYIRPGFYKTLDDLRSKQFFAEEFGQINKIVINNAGQEIELNMSSEYNEWSITKPVTLPAYGAGVAELLEKFQTLRISRFLDDDPQEVSEYGLDKPEFTFSVVNKEGRTFTIEAGKQAGTETHVRVAGEKPVHFVLNSDLNSLKKEAHDLRDPYLSIPAFNDIKEVIVTDATGSITIEKKDNAWMIGIQKVEESSMRNFVKSLGQARIFAFLEEKHKATLGLVDKENLSSVVIRTDSEPFRIWFGSREGANVGLMTEKDIMEVNAEIHDAFKNFMYLIRAPHREAAQKIEANSTASDKIIKD